MRNAVPDPWTQFIEDNEQFFSKAFPGRFSQGGGSAAAGAGHEVDLVGHYPPDNAA